MNKKSNKKLVAGLIALITLVIIGVTCSGFLDNFKVGMKFLGISFGVSLGLVLLLFIMKYIAKGADKLVGEGRTFNDRAIVVFSILILVSLTCGGFVKNFTMGIVFLIVSIVFVAITFLLMYGINSKKGEIKKVILAERTNGEKMFILLTALILVSLTCGGFIQNFKAGILFLIVSIISALALYLIVIEAKEENSAIGKVIRVKTTFNQKMIILLSTIIMVSLTCGGFLKNLKAGIVFLIISILFTTSMLMLVLGIKSKHKIYDKIAGFETSLNEKMMILLTTMAMVSITSGGFLYNFKVGMLFLIISITFSSLVLAGVISVKPRVNIFKMRARIQNLGKREAIRAFGMIFVCIFVSFNIGGTWAYFNNKNGDGNGEIIYSITPLKVKYKKTSSGSSGGGGTSEDTTKEYKGVTLHYDNGAGNAMIKITKYGSSLGENTTEYKMSLSSTDTGWVEYTISANDSNLNTTISSGYATIDGKSVIIPKNAVDVYFDSNGEITKVIYLDGTVKTENIYPNVSTFKVHFDNSIKKWNDVRIHVPIFNTVWDGPKMNSIGGDEYTYEFTSASAINSTSTKVFIHYGNYPGSGSNHPENEYSVDVPRYSKEIFISASGELKKVVYSDDSVEEFATFEGLTIYYDNSSTNYNFSDTPRVHYGVGTSKNDWFNGSPVLNKVSDSELTANEILQADPDKDKRKWVTGKIEAGNNILDTIKTSSGFIIIHNINGTLSKNPYETNAIRVPLKAKEIYINADGSIYYVKYY